MADNLMVLLCRHLLEVSATVLGDAAPSRQFIGGPRSADDCRQLTVHMPSALPSMLVAGKGRNQPVTAGQPAALRQAQFVVRLVQTDCWPTSNDAGTPPSPNAITTAAEELYTDTWTLWVGLRLLAQEGDLMTPFLQAGDKPAGVGRLVTFGPQGQTAGCTIEVSCDVLRLPIPS